MVLGLEIRHLNELEAFGIFFGKPADNRQQPDFGRHTWWLNQIRSDHAAKTAEEMLAAIHDQLLDG